MKLSIVIVNFNGGKLILSCIESIIRETKIDKYEIIVVDNDSSDNSIEKIREYYPFVNIIKNVTNIGFSAANNIGFKVARGEFILLLNPDTLITDGAINKSLGYAQEHTEVGLLGCEVLWGTGGRQSTLIKFPTLKDIVINMFVPYKIMRKNRWLGQSRYVGVDYSCEQDVDVIAGCYMMVNRAVLAEVGGLDEDFFMFGEEIEWCWRMYQSGRKVRYFPGSSIIHYGGGCSTSLSFRKVLLIAKGQLMVFKKTRGAIVALVANVLMLIRDLPRVIMWLMLRLINKNKADQSISLKASYVRFFYLFFYLIGFEKKI